MYDILQLNEMLVPELLDIAEQLKIANAKKLNKQDLVYKILDVQAIAGAKTATPPTDGKRKRIIKTTTSIGSEEAEVVSNDAEISNPENTTTKNPNMPIKKASRSTEEKTTAEEKAPIKKGRKKTEEKEVEAVPVVNETVEIPVVAAPAWRMSSAGVCTDATPLTTNLVELNPVTPAPTDRPGPISLL